VPQLHERERIHHQQACLNQNLVALPQLEYMDAHHQQEYLDHNPVRQRNDEQTPTHR